jgi:hypothetical protein
MYVGSMPSRKPPKMQDRMAGRAAVEEIPDREEQYPRDKGSDHVIAKP